MQTNEIFVIMPMVQSPTRDEQALTSFFLYNLKNPIESLTTDKRRFVVSRSDDKFDITKNIILDLYNSDQVICDLSGALANPNVMYELGVRLAISNKPVILIREKSPDNKRIFDISSFYIHEYDPLKYHELENHLTAKVQQFASSPEEFVSPVLEIVRTTPTVVHEVLREETVSRLYTALVAINGIKRIYAASVTAIANQVENVSFTNDIDSFPNEFNSQKDELSSVDWSDLEGSIRPHPAIDALITQPPTRQLMPSQELTLLRTFCLEIWTIFFASDRFFQSMNTSKVAMFFSEMNRLQALLSVTIDFLRNRVNAVNLKERFHDVLQDSVLMSDL